MAIRRRRRRSLRERLFLLVVVRLRFWGVILSSRIGAGSGDHCF